MVKLKHGLLSTLAAIEEYSFHWCCKSSKSMAECQLEGEEGWVVVKKQRITILVPPASPVHHQIKSPRTKQNQSKSKKTFEKRSHPSIKRRLKHSKDELKKPAGNGFGHEPQINEGGNKASETQQVPSYPPDPNACILPAPSPSFKARRVSNRDVGESTLRLRSLAHVCNGGNNGNHAPAKLRSSQTVRDGPRIGALQVVNQRIRASNLERKLEGLGGLRRWLASRGLSQFIQMFERERFDKFQLVNLTMGKLKDMGADAVGPRRKLIHAIDCLCQPYYFKAL